MSEQYHELSLCTLAHPDKFYFIHQHIVDAQTAQTADANTKPIAIVYALAGLYLMIEKNYTGRQVQQAHLQLSKNKKNLPSISLPEKRGEITAQEILKAPPGPQRDAAIKGWCLSVWDAYENVRDAIITYCDENLK
ncbi:hypothetical protein SAMN04488109_0035 [Chryseolinea serpens]|uniref:Uncharacterized protein n=1 Tax=Chryseolinea serpens TaxID=947013 RepID=A0A1M5JG15_9BACT|nr:DUF5946 family protein [Chryseolinea serpens]SHG39502.1 hypothetical protein SAMN04488109_0035 [Chryseolinea serpens]